MAARKKIYFEQPLNERIRTFLRLEALFDQADHQIRGSSIWDSKNSLTSLIDILTIFSRLDIKSELMKELERHIKKLQLIEPDPKVDGEKLQSIIAELQDPLAKLHSINGKVGQELMSNEFLSSIRQRASMPGGSCAFDLPFFHHWLNRPSAERQNDIGRWFSTFDAIREALVLVFELMRTSAPMTTVTAEQGFYQESLDTNYPCQLIRVCTPLDADYFPEISGGRHRFSVRFLSQTVESRPTQVNHNVTFELLRCVL